MIWGPRGSWSPRSLVRTWAGVRPVLASSPEKAPAAATAMKLARALQVDEPGGPLHQCGEQVGDQHVDLEDEFDAMGGDRAAPPSQSPSLWTAAWIRRRIGTAGIDARRVTSGEWGLPGRQALSRPAGRRWTARRRQPAGLGRAPGQHARQRSHRGGGRDPGPQVRRLMGVARHPRVAQRPSGWSPPGGGRRGRPGRG